MVKDSTIERCPHDKENPYVMINRALIRDNSISPNCRWLLMYLLSNKDGWEIKTSQLIEYCSPHLGRDRFYKCLNEAILSGYMKREEFIENGLKRCKYYLSESPKFKKDLPRPDFQDTENPHPENPHNKEEESSKVNNIDKNTPISPLKKGDDDLPSEAKEIGNDFIQKILTINPNFKRPKIEKWYRTLYNTHKIDDRSWDDIRSVLEYVFKKDPFWVKVIQSPDSLRRNFDKLLVLLRPPQNEGTRILRNREIALKIRNILEGQNEGHLLTICKSSIQFPNKQSVPMDLPTETFEDILLNRFNLRKKNG